MSARSTQAALLALALAAALMTMMMNPWPSRLESFLIALLVAGLLEARSVAGTRHGPFNCAAAIYLALVPVAGLGPSAAILCCSGGLVSRLILGPAPRLLSTTVADFSSVVTASLLAGLGPPELSLGITLVAFFATSLGCSRVLYPLLKSNRATRARFSLAAAVGAIPSAYLIQNEPTILIFLGAILLIGQSGGYMRIRQEALVETSRSLQSTRQDLVQARRERTQTTHLLERTARERELVENLARYFAQNPGEVQVMRGCLEAVAPLFPEAEGSLWKPGENGFLPMGPMASPNLKPPLELLAACWRTQEIQEPRQESPWILAPLPEEGVLALRLRAPMELSQTRRSLLLILTSQFALGLQSARYREQLKDALDLQTKTNRQLELSQEQLVQSSKMAAVGQLAAGVAHELNSPLAAALLQVQAGKVRLETGNLPKVASSLAIAEESLTVAQEIIEKLLNFSRASGSTAAPVDLVLVIESALEMLQEPLDQDKIQVETVLPRNLWVQGAEGELRQVFVNLLQNARYACKQKASERPPRILVEGKSQNGQVRVTVSDTGPGVPEEVAGRVFEPFFTTKPIGEGTGLGLSISFEIVKGHGGLLEMRSAPTGASFRVSLPLGSARQAG